MVKAIGIVSLLFYLVFLIILVTNLNKKNKIIKGIFAILIIIFLGILLRSNETVLDSVLALIVRYIYFPSFSTFMLIVLGSLIILLYSVYNDKLTNKQRIINYVFASWIIIDYIIFILLKLDVTSYNELYTGTSLTCLRFVTRGFLIWVVVLIISKLWYHYLENNRGE